MGLALGAAAEEVQPLCKMADLRRNPVPCRISELCPTLLRIEVLPRSQYYCYACIHVKRLVAQKARGAWQ